MTSPAKITANRRNALVSTGPKTPQGKRSAAANATRHGMLSRAALIPGEDARQLAAFVSRLRADLSPVGGAESFLADMAISYAWRLRRLMNVEVSILVEGRNQFIDIMAFVERAVSLAPVEADRPIPANGKQQKGPWFGLGTGFESSDGKDPFGKLGRYEAHLMRSFLRVLHELERRQAARAGNPVLPPVAIDVDVSTHGET